MSLQHFFLQNQDFSKDIELQQGGPIPLNLSKEDLHHAKVLRLKPNEHIGIIDSLNKYFEVEIIEFDNKLIVKNSQNANVLPSKNYNLFLCPGMSKANKIDDVIRACTEIGIDGFIPVMFKRSVIKLDKKKKDNKIQRWKNIAKSASMQSGRFSIPSINNILNFDDLCSKLSDFDYIFVCWEESKCMEDIKIVSEKIKNCSLTQNIAIVIGPEGGISDEEINQLKQCNKNTYIVSIGKSILRTETAGIVASAIINFNLSC